MVPVMGLWNLERCSRSSIECLEDSEPMLQLKLQRPSNEWKILQPRLEPFA